VDGSGQLGTTPPAPPVEQTPGGRRETRLVRRCAQVLHIMAEMAVGIAVIAAVGAGALAWRLSQGPLDMAWLARRLEVAANRDIHGTQLHIGGAALVWEGWRRGVDQPLDIRVRDTTAVAPDGTVIAENPAARIDLSPGWLLLGRVVPRVIEMDGARLRVLRAADGQVSLDLGTLADVSEDAPEHPPSNPAAPRPASPFDIFLTDLARPPQSDTSRLAGLRLGAATFAQGLVPISQLRRVRIHDARVVVIDRQLGAVWSAPKAEIDLRRNAAGAVSGTADLALELGQEHARISVAGTLAAAGTETRLSVRMTPISPAALARGAIGLAPLADLDAPLSVSVDASFGPRLAPRAWRAEASLGAGHVNFAGASLPLRQASLTWTGAIGTSGAMSTSAASLTVVLPTRGRDATIRVSATLRPPTAGAPNIVQAGIDLDQVPFADLGTYWPASIAADARKWVVENIPDGLAHDGHVDLSLAIPPDPGSAPGSAAVRLTALSGRVQGDNVTCYWLRPVPPIEHGQATLSFDSPDAMTIAVRSGQTGALQLHGGSVHITGLSQKDQDLTVNGTVEGPVTDAVAMLRQKRLHLLDHHPVNLRDPSGGSSTQLAITLPLRNDLTIEMVGIQSHTTLTNLHLTGFVAGRDVDQGQLDLVASQDGLAIQGTAQLAHIPADLKVGLDFRNGPPSQIVEHADAVGHATNALLAAAGLDPLGLVSGAVDLTAHYEQRRNGRADLNAHADMHTARLAADSVGWAKPAGANATLDAHLRLDHDQLVAIDELHAVGPDLMIDGHAPTSGGRSNTLVIDQAVLGRSRMHGEVDFPPDPTQPIRASVEGPLLDLSERLARHAPGDTPAPKKPSSEKGPPWVIDARFARVLMAKDDPLDDVTLHAENDGLLLQRGRLHTATAGELTLEPDAAGRHVTGQSNNAGALLRALDIADDMQGGRLTLDARYDDHQPGHPLLGSAEINDFRLRNAPALARLLQAMTLYGLVDLVQGPGLGFTRLVAPFRLEGDTLELTSARAYSSSLGLTAKGHFDLAANTLDVQGTIVPIYFFNSLLGSLPLVGELFSPEKGGGLFAASYGLHGALADPTVRVNPLTVLTPGFLRGIFD
jgi:hypothetical protein